MIKNSKNGHYYSDEYGKHQKAKQDFLAKKKQKGNKGNNRWENFGSDF